MGRVVNSADYTFSKAAKTITFSGAYTGLELSQIQLITDVTNNTIIYQFNKPTLGGTLAGLVLTLTYNTNTGAFNDTDDLMIIVNTAEDPLTDAELRATPVPVSGPLTDTELRATPVEVSLTNTGTNSNPINVTDVTVVDNTQIYAATISATGAISAIDASKYIGISMQLSGVWNGTIVVEGSNNNTDWVTLMVLPIDELSLVDYIAQPGIYSFKNATKYIRLNVTSLQTGDIVAMIYGRTNPTFNAIDTLSLAMDKTNKSPLYVEEIVGPLKRDINNALVPSDAPTPIYYNGTSRLNNVLLMVDTQGYQSLCLQAVTLGAGANMQVSNDGVNWISGLATCTSLSTSTTSLNTTGIFIIPCIGRYIRIVTTATSAAYTLIAWLRQVALPPIASAGAPINIQAVGGTSSILPGTYVGGLSSGPTAPSLSSFGGISAGGPYQPAPDKQYITSATSTVGALIPYPLTMGGRQFDPETYKTTGFSAGKLRTLLLDADGKVQIGGLPVSQSNQGFASAPVQDTSQIEGMGMMELLYQILQELRIQNQYMYELPSTLQRLLDDTSKPSLGYGNEPGEFRNDATMFVI
jgi:hypothetical protein